MKKTTFFYTLFFCLIITGVRAQDSNQCVHCNMIIKDKLHKATAEKEGKILQFDAIECLINYIKTKKESSFSSLKVSDYLTGDLINVTLATYLKSKAIPSPMGANLSAFKNRKEAERMKNKKGGELYNWKSLKEKLKDSKFGAVHHDHSRPDAHAPIGVMGDHLHTKGGFMVSLRYMNMMMEGNKSGTDNISDADIYNSFMVAPQEMTMEMYMLGIMYAPSDNVTIMLMQNFAKNNMDLTARMMMGGMTMLRDFSTESSGFGDLKLGALINIYNNHESSLHINSGVNIPVGDIENRGDTPMITDIKLPYAMQLGSGTFDMTIGGTFKENCENNSWGLQLLSTFRTGENSEGYRFGDLHKLNVWWAYKMSSIFSFSGRLSGTTQGTIKGIDAELNPMMVTTADTNNYGGDFVRGFLGLNIGFPMSSSLHDFRFGLEAGAPFYENYNGIQMDEGLTLNFGIKYSIKK